MNLEKYGNAVSLIEKEKKYPLVKLMTNIDGTTLQTQTISTSLVISSLAQRLTFDKLSAFLVIADRYEVLGGAISASYMNIPLVHIQGGEVSGNIDNKVRYATSALADLHFPCSIEAYRRLIKYYPKNKVFNFGCPAMDLVSINANKCIETILKKSGHVGETKGFNKSYFFLNYFSF